MVKRIIPAIILSVMLLAFMSSCGSPNQANGNESGQPAASETGAKDAGSDKKIVLEMYTHSYAPMVDVVKKMIANYEKENPNIKINYHPIPDDQFFTKLPILLSSKQPVDIINVHNSYLAPYLSLLSKAPDYVVNDIRTNEPSTYKIAQIDGTLYGYTYPDLHLMYVNTDMWEQAGLELPKTWDDLANAQKVMLKKENVNGKDVQKMAVNLWQGPGQNLFHVPEYNNIVEALGGQRIFDPDGTPHLDTPEAAQALDMFKTMVNRDSDFLTDFAQGNAATMILPRWAIPYLQENAVKGLKWKVLPPPAGKDGKPMGQGYFQMQVVPNYRPADNQEAAWKFLAWMHNDENNYILEKEGGFGDWRTTTIDRLSKEDPNEGVAFSSSQYATTAFVNKDYPALEKAIGTEIEKYVYDKADASTVLANAQAEVSDITGK